MYASTAVTVVRWNEENINQKVESRKKETTDKGMPWLDREGEIDRELDYEIRARLDRSYNEAMVRM